LRFRIGRLFHVEREVDGFEGDLGADRNENVARALDGILACLRLPRTEVLRLRHVAQLAPHLRGAHARVGV
jgi:hypothetical protein